MSTQSTIPNPAGGTTPSATVLVPSETKPELLDAVQHFQQACFGEGDYAPPENMEQATLLLLAFADAIGYFRFFDVHEYGEKGEVMVMSGTPATDRNGNPVMNQRGRRSYTQLRIAGDLPEFTTQAGSLAPEYATVNIGLWGLGAQGGKASRDRTIVRSESAIVNKLQAKIADAEKSGKADVAQQLRAQLNTVREALKDVG